MRQLKDRSADGTPDATELPENGETAGYCFDHVPTYGDVANKHKTLVTRHLNTPEKQPWYLMAFFSQKSMGRRTEN